MVGILFEDSRTFKPRWFGLEMEVLAPGPNWLPELNRFLPDGLQIEDSGYTHRVSTGWKGVTDSSIQGRYPQTGLELVSPILKTLADLTQIEVICRTLRDNGAEVNWTCGTHVHVQAKWMTPVQKVRLLRFYMRFENVLDGFVYGNRRGDNNQYCKSLLSSYQAQAIIRQRGPISDPGVVTNTRYYKVNFHSFPKYGTIEFRQLEGTLDHYQIQAWALLCQGMVKWAISEKPEPPVEEMLEGCGENILWRKNREYCYEDLMDELWEFVPAIAWADLESAKGLLGY